MQPQATLDTAAHLKQVLPKILHPYPVDIAYLTGRLHEILQDSLDDLTRYGSVIAQYAQNEQENGNPYAI